MNRTQKSALLLTALIGSGCGRAGGPPDEGTAAPFVPDRSEIRLITGTIDSADWLVVSSIDDSGRQKLTIEFPTSFLPVPGSVEMESVLNGPTATLSVCVHGSARPMLLSHGTLTAISTLLTPGGELDLVLSSAQFYDSDIDARFLESADLVGTVEDCRAGDCAPSSIAQPPCPPDDLPPNSI